MEAKELRIGNYVFDADNDIMKIAEIFREGCSFSGSNVKNNHSSIKQIPLTEDILLKCGFVKDNYGCYYLNSVDNNKNSLWLKDQLEKSWGVALNLFSTDKEPCFLNDIEHIHQLQNLYFALTGEELEINL